MLCTSCGTENPPGTKFCEECGTPFVQTCASCGNVLRSGTKFCGECGAPQLRGAAAARAAGAGTAPETAEVRDDTASTASARLQAGTTELRHVSVLFCDLVGFTPLAERHDPEELRELLSGYFELARAIISRYGGVLEKFIGDAVMAVWGAPVAKEDDAERAVRAGLELVSAVSAYGREHEVDLQARAGVATGEVATTETADEGLVIGDRVNTASRIQSAAAPGCCWVDETTRAATSVAIAYEDAGEHALKGKAAPVRLYRATRVVAAIAGSQRSGVLEAPFVGRDHELRLVKEHFHASSERGVARLVLVSGVAGVGKSRLAWEFFKYIDGLAGDVLWHAGRCLSYGEGVSYWALSEMVRSRLQIGEEDPPEVVAERLRTGLERWMPDPADREYLSPRIGQLLGLSSFQPLAKEDLFSGWRLFFERLAEFVPVVMVIEDLQWADVGMVEFLDHLLEWSGDHAIFILVLSRPEGTDRRELGLSRRSVTTLPLDPLPDELMGELLDGLVPGLPASAREQIVSRAEGIPLYAIETVRGLLDKGVVERRDDGLLHLVGKVGELETPPGLTALIRARLDALSPDERSLVKECSVLGVSFPRQAVEGVSDLEPILLDELLSSLVRKEVLTVRADKLSPERGQYAFTQSIIRSVAYEMLSRAERKTRHIRTAEHLRSAFPEGGAEIAEVIGAHLHDAYKASGGDADADSLRAAAREAYTRAAERAESVGAPEAAESHYMRACELSTDQAEAAALTERAGIMAQDAGWDERAAGRLEAAIAAYEELGLVVDAARVTAWLSHSLSSLGRVEQGISRVKHALGSLGSLEPGAAPAEVEAHLQGRLGGQLIVTGHVDEANEAVEQALALAQHYELPEQLARALHTKAYILATEGRNSECQAVSELEASLARRHGLTRLEASAETLLADLCATRDLPGAEEHCQAALRAARRCGHRRLEALAAGNLVYVLVMTGLFDQARRLGAELLESGGHERGGAEFLFWQLCSIEALRGNAGAARALLESTEVHRDSDDVQARVMCLALEAMVAAAEGDLPLALRSATGTIQEVHNGAQEFAAMAVRMVFPDAVDAAVGLGDFHAVRNLIEEVETRPPGEVPPFLRGQGARARGLLAAAEGRDEEVEGELLAAEAAFRELGYPYFTARARLDRAEWLDRSGRAADAEEVGREAATTFERLGATPMVARARALFERDRAETSSPAGSPAPR
jgi:class 3 adenylate cyclase/tetratricopeptide (TPR) repeat protein